MIIRGFCGKKTSREKTFANKELNIFAGINLHECCQIKYSANLPKNIYLLQ